MSSDQVGGSGRGSFSINVDIDGAMATLSWSGATTAETLAEAVSLAADDVILGRNVLRVEAQIPVSDQMARRALQKAGFRREGIRRHAYLSQGDWQDVWVFARLSTDQVYGAGGFSAVMDSVLPTKRVIGHVLFTDATGRVLLLQTSYKDDLELPGGVVEAGESPRVGAIREVAEELGLDIALGEPVLVDWMPPYLGWGDAIEFIFDGGVLTLEQISRWQLGGPEIVAAHWLNPDEVASRVTALSARRIALLLARRQGQVLFTENGFTAPVE